MTDDDGPRVDFSNPRAPRSARYGDTYFSAEDGLAESRAVFLAGCGLPEAWAGRRRFVVAELGFGTGLNILALLELWRRTRPAGGQLHVFTIEAHPLTRDEAARAHAAFPELAEVAGALLARWPSDARGWRRVDLPEFDATLDLAMLPVEQALADWGGMADAWFLDGFAPAANPAMWTPQVLSRVAALTRPGGRLASFTVAGHVRRALADGGLAVAKRPGFGRKRERLEAVRPGVAAAADAPGRVVVIGAGVAGASVARALAALGLRATVWSDGDEGLASGAAAARVAPTVGSDDSPAQHLSAQAFNRAVALYREAGAVIVEGGLQLATTDAAARRLGQLAETRLLRSGSVHRVEPGEALAQAVLRLDDMLAVEPATALTAWLATAERRHGRVTALAAGDAGWRLLGPYGEVLDEAQAVVLAGGWAGAGLASVLTAALRPVRGQLTTAAVDRAERPPPAGWGGYLLPTHDGLLFGATHDRDSTDVAPSPLDDAANLARLSAVLPRWAERAEAVGLRGRAAVRAATADHLPLAGRLATGLHVLSGLGGRGFTTAPLLAEHVAAAIAGAPSPLPADLARLVDPLRFAVPPSLSSPKRHGAMASGADSGRPPADRE